MAEVAGISGHTEQQHVSSILINVQTHRLEQMMYHERDRECLRVDVPDITEAVISGCVMINDRDAEPIDLIGKIPDSVRRRTVYNDDQRLLSVQVR